MEGRIQQGLWLTGNEDSTCTWLGMHFGTAVLLLLFLNTFQPVTNLRRR